MSSSTTIYLIRHAKAGERRVWTGDDIHRPLSTAGWRPSERLADRLAKKTNGPLLSSPYARCIQTLEPVGRLLSVDVGVDVRLAEAEPFEPVLELIAAATDGTVLCTHGDIIPDVVDALARRRMEVLTPPEWRKASVWVFKRKGDKVVKGKAWPPPT
jgi:8-oxo-dGTP diphosphatase